MTEDIRNVVLNGPDRDKKKFETFYTVSFVNKTSKLNDTIHKINMISLNNKIADP